LLSNQSPSLAEEEERPSGSDSSFNDLAIMGGVKRTNLSKDFRGGAATAVMGGVKVRVPASWTVVPRVNSIMGGFKDNTRRPACDDHRLVLKGTVLMG